MIHHPTQQWPEAKTQGQLCECPWVTMHVQSISNMTVLEDLQRRMAEYACFHLCKGCLGVSPKHNKMCSEMKSEQLTLKSFFFFLTLKSISKPDTYSMLSFWEIFSLFCCVMMEIPFVHRKTTRTTWRCHKSGAASAHITGTIFASLAQMTLNRVLFNH